MNRIPSFDIIRVIAFTGILVCHSCGQFPQANWFGFYCACTFNFLFLMMSALLMGLSWNNAQRRTYGADFLKKRVKRLSFSYYPYLAILFVFLYIAGSLPSIHKIIAHILYLPWFAKLSGFYHLWYITLIVICYGGCTLFSRYLSDKKLTTLSWILGGGYFVDTECDSRIHRVARVFIPLSVPVSPYVQLRPTNSRHLE
ncbi:MAG: acyltransferase [Muribaculum sp.]|nr:acyltransferase [Muribaculum sp.]